MNSKKIYNTLKKKSDKKLDTILEKVQTKHKETCKAPNGELVVLRNKIQIISSNIDDIKLNAKYIENRRIKRTKKKELEGLEIESIRLAQKRKILTIRENVVNIVRDIINQIFNERLNIQDFESDIEKRNRERWEKTKQNQISNSTIRESPFNIENIPPEFSEDIKEIRKKIKTLFTLTEKPTFKRIANIILDQLETIKSERRHIKIKHQISKKEQPLILIDRIKLITLSVNTIPELKKYTVEQIERAAAR